MHLGQVELIVIRPFVCAERSLHFFTLSPSGYASWPPCHRRLVNPATHYIALALCGGTFTGHKIILFPFRYFISSLWLISYTNTSAGSQNQIYYLCCWSRKGFRLTKHGVARQMVACHDGTLHLIKLIGLMAANLVMCGLHKPNS